jgi:hypothetical protein
MHVKFGVAIDHKNAYSYFFFLCNTIYQLTITHMATGKNFDSVTGKFWCTQNLYLSNKVLHDYDDGDSNNKK